MSILATSLHSSDSMHLL